MITETDDLQVMVQVSNSFYYYCNHQNFCHPFCYRRVMRGCGRLMKAVRKVYGEEFGVKDDKLIADYSGKKKSNKKDKNQNRKVSDQTTSTVSPIRRKDSMGKKDRYCASIKIIRIDFFLFLESNGILKVHKVNSQQKNVSKIHQIPIRGLIVEQ